MRITGTVKVSLESYINEKKVADMTAEEKQEVVESFKAKGAQEVLFF